MPLVKEADVEGNYEFSSLDSKTDIISSLLDSNLDMIVRNILMYLNRDSLFHTVIVWRSTAFKRAMCAALQRTHNETWKMLCQVADEHLSRENTTPREKSFSKLQVLENYLNLRKYRDTHYVDKDILLMTLPKLGFRINRLIVGNQYITLYGSYFGKPKIERKLLLVYDRWTLELTNALSLKWKFQSTKYESSELLSFVTSDIIIFSKVGEHAKFYPITSDPLRLLYDLVVPFELFAWHLKSSNVRVLFRGSLGSYHKLYCHSDMVFYTRFTKSNRIFCTEVFKLNSDPKLSLIRTMPMNAPCTFSECSILDGHEFFLVSFSFIQKIQRFQIRSKNNFSLLKTIQPTEVIRKIKIYTDFHILNECFLIFFFNSPLWNEKTDHTNFGDQQPYFEVRCVNTGKVVHLLVCDIPICFNKSYTTTVFKRKSFTAVFTNGKTSENSPVIVRWILPSNFIALCYKYSENGTFGWTTASNVIRSPDSSFTGFHLFDDGVAFSKYGTAQDETRRCKSVAITYG